jgi:hypothetical protein
MTIKDSDRFKGAIRTMLVLEVAGRAPEGQSVQPAGGEKRISCTIGEPANAPIWSRPPGKLPAEFYRRIPAKRPGSATIDSGDRRSSMRPQ